ncbi:MAG: hypothetical protein HQL64_14500 [Magnetococcales bacterium]|nr:hypothetical protein [Magnetococcales bacterium]
MPGFLRISEAISDAFKEAQAIQIEEMAAKRDLKELEGQASTKADVAKVDVHVVELKRDIEAVKTDMLKWTAGMFAAQTALIIGAMFAMMKMNQPAQPTHTPPYVSQETRLPSPPPQAPAPQPVK